MKKIFLTGERNVGKTTIIERIVFTNRLHPAGFCTVIGPAADQGDANRTDDGESKDHDQVFIVPFNERHRGPWSVPPVAIRDLAQLSFVAYPKVFDTHGVDILRHSLGADLIVMDELGFMEDEATAFKQAVISVIEGPTPVLGVLKKKDTPFLNQIRNHNQVYMFEVTLANRDVVFEALQGLLRHLGGASAI